MNAPLDMSLFVEAKSHRLNADDLVGGPRTVTVTGVSESGSEEGPVNIHYQGDNGKPFQPCKTMRRVIIAAWGKWTADYAGRSMTLYRDPEVQFGGMKLGGVRISHMSHLDGPLALVLAESKKKKSIIKVTPLATRPAQDTRPPAADPSALHGGSTSSAGAGAAPTGELPAAVQEWVDSVIGEIRACQSITDLAELQAARKVETKLARYPKQRDDLVALFNDRRAVIEGAGE